MSQISVISKLTGVETTTEGTQITLDHSSIVKLNVDRADISDYSRSGNDLVITLHSGEVITLKNFYVTDAQGVSQLVLEESDGALWWIEDPTGAATYESIASTDALLAASGSDTGGAAAWPWVLGGLAVAGGIAIAAGTGGGGGGDDDNNSPNPGNPGNPSGPDTTPPDAPTNLQVSPDGKTVTGTAEPGSTVTLKDADGNTIGTGKADSDGKFTIDLGTPLTNGEQITATATDPSGNTSQGGQVTAPDLTAPDAPANLEVSPDGKTVTGTAEPGSTVTLKDADGNTIGTGKADSDGKFTIDLGTPLTNGEQITATATDPSGNTSPGVQVTAPDSTSPDAPEIVTVNDNVGTETGPLSNGQRTDDARPTFSGISEAGTVITFYDNGKPIGTTTADATGKWSFTPSTNLSEGNHAITTTATDAAGNTSPASTAVTFVVDTVAPGAPAIVSINDDVAPGTGTLGNGSSTNDPRPQLTGTAEAGSTVTIYDNGIAIGTAVVGSNGSWSFTPSVNLSEGSHQLTVRATDVAGNTGPASPVFTVTVDVTAPQTPAGFIINDDTGVLKGAIGAGQFTDASEPRLTGRGEPGSTITVYDNGAVIGTTTVLPNGTWSITPTSPLAEGAHSITLRETDAAGNQSGLSQPINFTVDLTPPDMPEATLNSTGTQITGTAEPGSTIVITNNAGLQIGTATADSNGNYVANLNPAQTNGEIISVVASDAAGNQSSPALVNAADITPPAAPGNLVVADDGASVSGTAEPNSTIIIKAPDGTIIGQDTAGPDGTFTIPISPAQTNGEALEVTATDGSGNTSPSGFADAPDSTPPLAPENVVISADGTTVTGTAEPGSTVTIRENGVKVGEAVADDQGNFSVDLIPPKANGEALTADATDTAGNTGPTAPFDAPDITAAQTPVITGVVDDAPDVTGPVSQNGLTNDSTPTINGTGEPGTTITLYSGTTEIGTGTVGPDGQWSITLTTALPDGGHVLTATAVDANNNLSGTSNTWSITVDTAAPGAPAITQVIDDVPGRTGALDTNETTNDTLPTLNGTGEPGSTVTIRLDGQPVGTALVNSGGAWTFTPTTPLVNGEHTFTVVAIDAAGNASATSAGFTLTVDTTPPPAATIDTVSDNIGPVQLPLNSGDTTDDTLPQLQGTAPDGTTITIYDGTTLLGTAVLDGNGGWSFTPTTPLTDGPHSLTVHATDNAGNTTISPPFELAIDTTAPATPDIPEITVNPDGGTPGTALNPGETTRDTTPTLSGSGTPGDTVNIYDGATKIGEADVGEDGTWSWTPEDPLPDGTYDLSLTVTNQDSAGNESAPSTPVTITIDTDAPAQPGTPTVTDSVSQITGPVLDGESTNDPRPVLSGTGTPNDVITIYDQVGTGEPQAVGSVTVDGNGNWSWRPESNIGEGTHEYTATATDEAGNESVPSTGITITVDTLAPDTPTISAIGGAQNGGSTNETTPGITGAGTTGETVIIYNNGVEVARVEVVNGEWSYTLPTQTDGPLNITVAAVDEAGNVSQVSPVFTVEVDTQAPTVPQIDAVSDSQLTNSVLYTRDGTPTLTGIGEPGSSVTVSVDGVASPVVVEVQPNGTWSWTADPALTEGPHTFSVTASDAAGNTSASSGDLSVTVDTLPPATPTDIAIAAEGTPLTGTADDGTTVTVRDANGNVIGTGVATGGSFSIALSPAQLDPATLTLTATDAAGNASPSTTFVVPDSPLDLPAVPVITAINDDADPVTGDVKEKTTNDTTPTLTGTAEPGSVIAIYQDGVLVPLTNVVADVNGNWSYTPPLPLTEGPHTFAVTATDIDTGATSGQSPVATVTVDLTAPTAPAIGAVTDDVGPITGPIADGQSTNDNRPTLTGTGTAGDTITVYNNGDPLGTVVVGPTGTWSYTPPALDDGSHTLTVTATDPAGNESTPSTGITIVVDTVSTTPVITSVTDNAGNAATPVPSGDPTNDTTPTLTGTAEPNSVVAIFDGATQIGTVAADGTGAWTFTPETALGEGTHDFTVRATDPQGNVSQPSGVWSINIDLTAPQVPTIDTVSDNVPGGVTGPLTAGQVTNDTTPTLSGTGQAGTTIHVLNNGVEIGTTTVDGSGNWTFTPDPILTDGTYNLRVNASDDVGNVSANSPVFAFTVDTTGPAAPVVTTVIDDVGPGTGTLASNGATNDTRPTFNGTGEVGATVHVIVDDVEIGTAVVNAQGNWSFTPTTALGEGPHTITFNATDAAGNTGDTSLPFNLTVDTSVPVAPVFTPATDNVGTVLGPVASGQSTDDTTPTLNGTAAANATITIYENGQQVGTAVADANGVWSFTTGTLANGSHTWTATATDAAGNVSPASPGFTLVVDTTVPAAPVITQAIDDVGTLTGAIGSGQTTNDPLPRLVGTSEPLATVNIYEGTTLVGTGTADANGNWTVDITVPLDTGSHTFTAEATDQAGNTGAPSADFSLTIDTTPPALPVLTSITDDVGNAATPVANGGLTNDARPTLTGTAEAGATVTIFDNGVQIGTAVATGGACNTSAPSPIITINVDLTPPPAPTGLAVITNGTQVTGTAEAGSTVTITSSTGTVLGTAVADGSGNFSATLTPPQTGGESLIVFATDKAGNAGITTSVIAPITTIPNAPVITSIDDNVGTVTGNLTNGKTTDDTTPTLSGTAQPNATITLYNNGVSMGTVTANASGNWSFTTPVLSEGPHAFTATASNGSGTSPISTSTTVIVDLTAPTAPTGTFNADGSVLTGSAEAGSTVTIRLADNSTVTATADSNGSWSYTFLNKQTEGQTLQITATDAAGNVSLPGSALAPVVPLSASTNVEELALTTTATVTNSQYSDYGFLLVGAVGNVLTLLGNDTAQVGFTVGSGGSADIAVNANATGAVLSLLNTLELVVQRFDAANNTWTTVVDTGQPQFADLLTLGATGVSLNLTGLADGQYRVLSYNTNLLATGSYTSLDVAVKETSAGTVSGETNVVGNVITDVDPTAGSDNAPAGTTVTAVTNAQGTTTSVTADGTVIQGQYGTLTINLDGSYTYNLTNTSAAVIGRTESFTYTITHNGTSASANLVLSLGEGTSSSGIVAVDDTASLTFDTTVEAINNGTSSQGGFTLVGINLGNTLGLNLLDDLANPIIYSVEEGTTRTMTVQASVGGVALASVFDLYIYKFNNATQTFEQMRVEPGWLRAPLLGGTSSQLTLNLPAGEYLFLLNTAAGITALTAYTLNVLQDHVYSVASVSESTTGDVLADDIAPAGTVVSDVNGVAVNSNGLTEITGEYGTLRINAAGEYTYTLDSGVGADHISTPDTFVYTITAPDGSKDTASLNITPTARPMDAVNDVSTAMDVTSVHHTSTYTDTSVGTASWTTALLGSTQGSGSGTFVVDANTALHNASLHFNVASLLALGGLTVNWSITDGTNVIRSGSFSGGSLLGGSIDVPLTGLDLNAGTYTLNFTGSVPGLSVGNITITPSVNGTTYSLSQFDATGTHTVDGNIFDGTGSAGAMDQLHSVDTRVSITGFDGVITTLDPYTGSTMSNITGHYGTLAIAADGSYTYTLNPGISLSTITSKEVFNYTLTDANGVKDTASLTIDMAPKFVSSEHNDVISGTAYGDTLIYQVLNNTAGNATAGNSTGDHWTNFSLTQGDKIDIGDLLVGWNGSASTLGNYVSVSQSGNNTVISIDRDGTGAAYTKSTLVTLDNVQTTYDELVNQQHIIT